MKIVKLKKEIIRLVKIIIGLSVATSTFVLSASAENLGGATQNTGVCIKNYEGVGETLSGEKQNNKVFLKEMRIEGKNTLILVFNKGLIKESLEIEVYGTDGERIPLENIEFVEGLNDTVKITTSKAIECGNDYAIMIKKAISIEGETLTHNAPNTTTNAGALLTHAVPKTGVSTFILYGLIIVLIILFLSYKIIKTGKQKQL